MISKIKKTSFILFFFIFIFLVSKYYFSEQNIVFTNRGEKFFDPDFGSDVTRTLFENVDEVTALNIKDDIENSIKNYEPRVELVDVAVVPDYDGNQFYATITYIIVGLEVPAQELEFVLLPSR